MKIIFWGTPEFSIPSLDKIYSSSHEVLAVVTSTDKEQGRGMKLQQSAVKTYALDRDIPVLQPDNFHSADFLTDLNSFGADIFVIVAFKILPESIFNFPPKGSFNLHGSLLPKYRGAAPIQWALINGDKETGVTTFKLEAKVDTGNVYIKKSIKILFYDNFGTLHDKMSVLGSEAVIETLEIIEEDNFTLSSQDNTLATSAPKITKDFCKINWSNSAESFYNLIRGLSPFPGAFFHHKDNLIKIYSAIPANEHNLASGAIKQFGSQLFIGCGGGTLEILELQREGKKKMSINEFLRGYSFH